ncbi:LexA family transcriptional regulator [uncultured Acidaminococcus sp.]|uniref:LexA family protein n=2 Tax=uncultured Acidaminococcus sp. TaxID=352152 RepID=UPI0026659FE7|nr:XRE family transcriptional regulator [uncultured Acidaminococcus sp.]
MAFAEKLKELRQQKGMTQSELAKLLKMQRSTLGMYETGKREPNFETLNMFANFFNVDMNTLMDMNNTSNQNPSSPVRSIKIPVLGTVVAGVPLEAVENIIGWEEISPAMAATGEHFALRIKGTSMEPRICEGDIVVVRKQEDIESGDTAIVLINGGEATVKKVKKTEEGIMLIANNMAVYSPHFYSNKEIEELPVRIIGKVVELRGKL